MGAPSNLILLSDFSTRGCVLYNAHGRAIGPRLGLSGGSWPILRPWQDRSQHRFLQNQVPEKQLVWTCQAGPSTSRGKHVVEPDLAQPVPYTLGTSWFTCRSGCANRAFWLAHGLRLVYTRPKGQPQVIDVQTFCKLDANLLLQCTNME